MAAWSDAAESVTVNTKLVVPLSPSGCETLLIDTDGGASSLTIVPIPCELAIVASTALLRFTLKVSSGSSRTSPFTLTVIV